MFLRCSHSRRVQGSREEDDLFGGSCFWSWTVVLCPHHLLPQGTCHPLAVIRPSWLALMLLVRHQSHLLLTGPEKTGFLANAATHVKQSGLGHDVIFS